MAIISNINMELKELNMSENLLNSRNLNKQKEVFICRKVPKDLSEFNSLHSNENNFLKTPTKE